jgi:cell division protein FtsW (lipid II flippase)
LGCNTTTALAGTGPQHVFKRLYFLSLTKPQNKMKSFDKQILYVFAVVTVMPLVTALVGSGMNYVISLTFMCTFAEIQLSSIWIMHTIVGLLFTVMLLLETHNHG